MRLVCRYVQGHETSDFLLARNDHFLSRHGLARKASQALKTATAIVRRVSTVIVASGPRLAHCRGRSLRRGSRLQFPCIWVTHYKAEKCSRCKQSVARSGDARVSCVRASSLCAAGEAVCGRVCVVRLTCFESLFTKTHVLSLCILSGTGTIDSSRWYDSNMCNGDAGFSFMPTRFDERTTWWDHWNVSAWEPIICQNSSVKLRM